MVGVKNGPPKEMVFPQLLGRKECNLDPADLDVILTVYKYDTTRYYVNVYDTGTQRLCDLVLNGTSCATFTASSSVSTLRPEGVCSLNGDVSFAIGWTTKSASHNLVPRVSKRGANVYQGAESAARPPGNLILLSTWSPAKSNAPDLLSQCVQAKCGNKIPHRGT